MPSQRRNRRGRAAARYESFETADLIRHRTLASVRSALQALQAFDPPLKRRVVRPAAMSSVAAMADALTKQIMSALADLDEEEGS